MQTSEGTWIESITLFEQIREGDYGEAISLLDSSSDPTAALYGLGRLVHCFFHSVDSEAVDSFAETARKMPPPRIPPSLNYTPPIAELAATHITLIADDTKVHHEPDLEILDNQTLQLPPSSPLLEEQFCGAEIEVIFVDPHDQHSSYRFPGHLTTGGTIKLRTRY